MIKYRSKYETKRKVRQELVDVENSVDGVSRAQPCRRGRWRVAAAYPDRWWLAAGQRLAVGGRSWLLLAGQHSGVGGLPKLASKVWQHRPTPAEGSAGSDPPYGGTNSGTKAGISKMTRRKREKRTFGHWGLTGGRRQLLFSGEVAWGCCCGGWSSAGRGVPGRGPAWHDEETCPRLLSRHEQGRRDEVDTTRCWLARWMTSQSRWAEAAAI